MTIYINRALNMKRIKAIGLDMDYTIVRYKSEAFEALTYETIKKKLVEFKNYPQDILKLVFDFSLVIQGLVIDKDRGNLLKLSRFGRVKSSTHGLKALDFKTQQETYKNIIDLSDPYIQSLDTDFAVSNGVLYTQLIELKEEGLALPSFAQMADDVKAILDLAHADGSLKNEVRKNTDRYIIKDPEIVQALERLKRHGKKILLITNSDFNYTKLLLDFAIAPFLKDHKHWSELFHFVITASRKPRFFTDRAHFLKIDLSSEMMSNFQGPLLPGIYQGGNAFKLQNDLQLEGDEILYLGDHIYGDVLSLKKTFNWRTGLVLGPLEAEVEGLKKAQKTQQSIDQKMQKKEELELKLNALYTDEIDQNKTLDKSLAKDIFDEMEKLNSSIANDLKVYKNFFNPHWGELMRAGQEESRFAGQVEKYACIYMAKVSDLLHYCPRTYFRPIKRILPHEINS